MELVEDMSANPQDHEKLRMTADLLPVGEARVTAHAPVETSSNSGYHVLSETSAIRGMEGGTGHWMGMLPRFSDVGGVAAVGGQTSASIPRGPTIAHELGHNLSLRHAPCGGPRNIDSRFPDPRGRIGAWGYAVRKGELVSYRTFDLMSYCGPEWISPYHFTKALEYRVWEGPAASRVAAAPVQSLLLWGGADSTGTPYLEPVFVVAAPPSLPDAHGPWTIEGRDADGAMLFALPFAMPEIADAGEGAGGFAFVLPTGRGWEALASVTLSGPGGTAALDADTDRTMSIWRDRDGQVRAILRGPAVAQRPVGGVVRGHPRRQFQALNPQSPLTPLTSPGGVGGEGGETLDAHIPPGSGIFASDHRRHGPRDPLAPLAAKRVYWRPERNQPAPTAWRHALGQTMAGAAPLASARNRIDLQGETGSDPLAFCWSGHLAWKRPMDHSSWRAGMPISG